MHIKKHTNTDAYTWLDYCTLDILKKNICCKNHNVGMYHNVCIVHISHGMARALGVICMCDFFICWMYDSMYYRRIIVDRIDIGKKRGKEISQQNLCVFVANIGYKFYIWLYLPPFGGYIPKCSLWFIELWQRTVKK